MNTNNTSAANCTHATSTEKEAKLVLVLYAVFAAVAVLFHVTAILIIVKTRAYRLFDHRITIYLTIGGILRTVAYMLQVLPVDIYTSPVTVKKGWDGACVLGGFMIQYSPLFQTLTVVWTSYIILKRFLHTTSSDKSDEIGLKREIAGVTISILAPFLFIWGPFITHSYGFSVSRCWIVDNCHDLQLIYLMTINIIPNLLLTLVGITLLGGAIIILVRKVMVREGRFLNIVMKEDLPLAIYPICYLLIIFARMIALLSRKYTDPVALFFVVATELSSCALPLSLLVRPSLRRSLCQTKKGDENESSSHDEEYVQYM